MKWLLLLSLFLSFPVLAKSKKDVEEEKDLTCHSTREYVATLKFIQKKASRLGLSEANAKLVADEVSQGCDGSAQRFIDIVNALLVAELDPKSSVETGLRFAKATDIETKNFLTVFKRAFLGKYLDLDLRNSVKLAESLSIDYKGEAQEVASDFIKLVSFCTDTKKLDLPYLKCAQLAAKVTSTRPEFKPYAANDFLKLFKFIRDDKPHRSSGEALQIAEEVVTFGPTAAENYIQAYQFAASKSGLQYEDARAMEWAMLMAKRSLKPEESKTK